MDTTGRRHHWLSPHCCLVHLCQALKLFFNISTAILTKIINRNYRPNSGRSSASWWRSPTPRVVCRCWERSLGKAPFSIDHIFSCSQALLIPGRSLQIVFHNQKEIFLPTNFQLEGADFFLQSEVLLFERI